MTTTTPQTTARSVWSPVRAGALDLPHRLAMAPMTRSRALPDGTPTPDNALYYGQRASMGLVIAEGTQPSDDGQGYLLTPGIYTDSHVEGWRAVADAVHAGGGTLVVQLMHVGRISHPDNTPHHRQAVAPSAVAPEGPMFTAAGMQPMPVPRELSVEEIAATVADFARAASCAIAAGADGVEIHGATGYLPQQFLSSNANQRTDSYGGSVENRTRFVLEVARAIAAEIGADRTGIRLSPGTPINDIREDDPEVLYPELVARLAELDLAYLHLVDPGDDDLVATLRAAWPGTLVMNRGGTDLAVRIADVEDGPADISSIGVMALANPDLVARIKAGGPFNEADQSTLYAGDEHGYTDYPTLDQSPAAFEAAATAGADMAASSQG